MLQLHEIELALLHSTSAKDKFADSVDTLLAHLLSDVPGFSTRATDGVLLEYFHVGEEEIVASGISILIDQTVHPLRIELGLDAHQALLVAGALYFGDNSRPHITYGSPAHGKLVREILAYPRSSYSWEQSWRRTGQGWARNW